VVAGMMHSTALTADGALFYWVSSDPDLKSQQVLFLLIKVLICTTK
jgi:inhibitor of Bruton tyrosine kinase